MRKFISCTLLLVLLINLTSCGDDMTIRNKKVETYGLLTLDEAKPNVKYRLIAGNVIWSILLAETIVLSIFAEYNA